jgi:hypothetical protein
MEYDPILCQKQSCKAALNPLWFIYFIFFKTGFSMIDYRTKMWLCPFCNQRNPFPPHYANVSEENKPPELHPFFTTVEYTLRVFFINFKNYFNKFKIFFRKPRHLHQFFYLLLILAYQLKNLSH